MRISIFSARDTKPTSNSKQLRMDEVSEADVQSKVAELARAGFAVQTTVKQKERGKK